MVEIVKSATFDRWLRKLRDRRAAARVLVRIDRLAAGNPGDVKPVGSGISEVRIDYGPGYRVYYLQEGQRLIVLLWRQVRSGPRHRASAPDRRGVEER
jgi:putative addiction module killer protein